jgi:chemotaxis protein methyltransferase CheR
MLTQSQLQAVEDVELRLLLDGLFYCYGLDYRDYAADALRRQVWEQARAEGLETLSAYQARVLHESAVLERLVAALAMPAVSLFHEPAFYAAFRTAVVPRLRTYPSVKIWQPGCRSGEEVIALAILLSEEGLLPRVRLYGTDLSPRLFARGAAGRIPMETIVNGADRYRAAGGTRSLDDYFTRDGEDGILVPDLRSALVFSAHSLATDDVFNEFEVIVCRSTFGSFNQWLTERVHRLFSKSLSRFGFLCLGSDTSLRGTPAERWYEPCDDAVGIYRKTAP